MATKPPAGKNVAALKKARVIREEFTAKDLKLLESLSPAEIKAVISIKKKLGEPFFKRHMPHGMMF
jgi:hypothetical protein